MIDSAVVMESLVRSVPFLGAVLLLHRGLSRATPDVRGHLLLMGLLGVWSLPVVARLIPPIAATGLPSLPERALAHGVVVWGVGAGVFLARIVWGVVRLRHFVRVAEAEGRVVRVPGARARVVLSPVVRAPMAVGLWRPRVLLPPTWRDWPRDLRRAVLAHELAHLANGDPWRRLLGAVTAAVHWPNPFVRSVVGASHLAAEEDADRAAVRSGVPAVEWAAALVAFSRSRSAGPDPALSVGVTSSLERRVRTLVGRRAVEGRGVNRRGALAVGGALIVLGLLSAADPAAPDERTVLAERWGVDTRVVDLVVDAARREGVDPRLAFALVHQESRFDAERVSRSGAVGYLQILPETAARLAPDLDPDRLVEPEINLSLGLRFLATLLARYPDAPERALYAYAEGPGAAREPRESYHTGYVRSVLRAAGLDRS